MLNRLKQSRYIAELFDSSLRPNDFADTMALPEVRGRCFVQFFFWKACTLDNIPGSSRYVKFLPFGRFFGEFRHKLYTQKEDPGITWWWRSLSSKKMFKQKRGWTPNEYKQVFSMLWCGWNQLKNSAKTPCRQHILRKLPYVVWVNYCGM